MLTMIRTRHPQRSHCSMSMRNTRLSRCAHLMARCRSPGLRTHVRSTRAVVAQSASDVFDAGGAVGFPEYLPPMIDMPVPARSAIKSVIRTERRYAGFSVRLSGPAAGAGGGTGGF